MLSRSLLEALYNPQYQTLECQGRISRFKASLLQNMLTTYAPADAVIIYANKHLSLEAQDAFATYIIRGGVDDLINFSQARWAKKVLACHHGDNHHDSMESSSSSSSSSSPSTPELSEAASSIPPGADDMPSQPTATDDTTTHPNLPASTSSQQEGVSHYNSPLLADIGIDDAIGLFTAPVTSSIASSTTTSASTTASTDTAHPPTQPAGQTDITFDCKDIVSDWLRGIV